MDNVSVVRARSMPFHYLEEITNHFSEDRKLGVGAYGTVYMGEHRDGEKIMVNMLHNIPGLDDSTNFDREYNNLSSIQHKNIVRLVGYCHETTREPVEYNGIMVFAERTRRALCFEYMPNGSISSCLCDEYEGLDWCTRYAIIKGICEGLKYLHEEMESPMYHLDLKPNNVLLDEKLVPKITGFYSSRFFRDEKEEITKTIAGTRGYVPPEYIDMGLISNKFDIFSLGVTIIKIMTGHTGYSRTAEMYSSHEFIENVHDNWSSRLRETPADELESYCKQVKTCAEIALSCVEIDRHKRPSIGDIFNKLTEIETMSQFPDELRNVVNPPSASDSTPAPAPTQTLAPEPPTPHPPSAGSPYTHPASHTRMSSSPAVAEEQNVGTGTIGSLSTSQVRPGEISCPQQPSPGLPSSGTPSSSGSQMPGSQVKTFYFYVQS